MIVLVTVFVIVTVTVAVAHPSSSHLLIEAEQQLFADPAFVTLRLWCFNIQVSQSIEEDVESPLVHALPFVDDDQISLLGLQFCCETCVGVATPGDR